MTNPRISEEAQRNYEKGKEIYETKIKHLVDPQEKGKFLVLDITTEEYVIGPDLGYATQELRERCPDAILHTVRIGYSAVYKIPRMR